MEWNVRRDTENDDTNNCLDERSAAGGNDAIGIRKDGIERVTAVESDDERDDTSATGAVREADHDDCEYDEGKEVLRPEPGAGCTMRRVGRYVGRDIADGTHVYTVHRKQ